MHNILWSALHAKPVKAFFANLQKGHSVIPIQEQPGELW